MCLKDVPFTEVLTPTSQQPCPWGLEWGYRWESFSFEPTSGAPCCCVRPGLPSFLAVCHPRPEACFGAASRKGRNPSLLSSLLSCSPLPTLSGRGHGYSLQDCIAVPRGITWGGFVCLCGPCQDAAMGPRWGRAVLPGARAGARSRSGDTSLKCTHVPLSGRGEVPRRITYAQSLCPNVYTAGADEGVGSKVRNHSYGETPVGK